MVSDQCQALHRDNIFGANKDGKMTLREAESDNEMIPSVLMEGKKVETFEPEFFIVKLGNG